MRDGFIKAAAGTPDIRVADVEYNRDSILRLIDRAADRGVKLLVLPELCLTGYTCGDLFLQSTLTRAAEKALGSILSATADRDMLFALGLPVEYGGKLYNCAAVCAGGQLLALVPKRKIPNYGEFYESRWFASGDGLSGELTFAGRRSLLSPRALFHCAAVDGLCVGVELCEDLWSPAPPSGELAAGGATVILNLSASDEVAAKADYRRSLVTGQSARLVCAYLYADAGEGESTTDMVFAGHNLIAENGELLTEKRFETGLTVSELDITRLVYERKRISTYPAAGGEGFAIRPFDLTDGKTELTRRVSPFPFVPEEASRRAERCDEIIRIAALGLKKRAEHTGAEKLVLGVSGGLDSTLAMLISARALDMLGLPRSRLLAVTMPGFGTTSRTKGNAEKLAEKLGAELRVIPISEAVRLHFADIGHDEAVKDAVYENTQARERTQVLMDLANGMGGIAVGTGDMSELALGWATYNGDHMSMYGVNAGIPKTLVRHMVAFCADTAEDQALAGILRDILDTPVSPELLPAEAGAISQKTEELVGPYELHDFFLYHLIRWGRRPRTVLRLAEYAFGDAYDREAILKWLEVFIRRFFSQQFKRSCLPDGPKVGTLSLSPRGDLRMPSDAQASLWLEELEQL